jgi:arginase family enzyme
VLSAVSYAQSLGLDCGELVKLLEPLAATPNLLGVSVAGVNPDGAADGTRAARVVEALELLLGSRLHG